MSAVLPLLTFDSTALLSKYFMPHQVNWIQAEDVIHAQDRPAFALAEKSLRIGWTYADAFKNVRKRLPPNLTITWDIKMAQEMLALNGPKRVGTFAQRNFKIFI